MQVRIINIHGIGEPRRTLEQGEDAYWISEAAWEQLLDMTVSGDFLAPERYVFTFDDGNLSDFDIGAPALEARGLKASFFPLAGRTDTEGSLSGENMRALVAAGHKIGTHGHDHVDWRKLDDESAAKELETARATLEAVAGVDIDMAAIPFGAYDRATLARLKAAGYRIAYTSDGGGAEDGAWLQPRTSVRKEMGEADFAWLLSGEEKPARKLRRFAAMAKKRVL